MGSPARPLLLAIAVHWDDCSVAIGNQASIVTEVWSAQPERMASLPGGSPRNATAVARNAGGSPVASRDALLLLDRLLVRTGTALSAIDQLCFARGPGAFTSLRVAAGLVQGLSLATSIPVAGICSLAVLTAHEPAWHGEADGDRSWLQLAALDARMGECYFAVHLCHSGSHPVPVVAPGVGSPARAIAVFEEVLGQRHEAAGPVLAGNGFRLLPELTGWARRIGRDPEDAGRRAPTAAAVLAVAASAGAPLPGPARMALPVYVRDKIALDVTEQRENAAARSQGHAASGAARAGA
jgi:tRNA threonylcarbamoyladenosine biosynthesis protein TsaB